MISFEELAKNFEKVLGAEESRKLVETYASKVGIGKKEFYSKEEAIKICRAIKEEETGFINVIANVLLAKLLVS